MSDESTKEEFDEEEIDEESADDHSPPDISRSLIKSLFAVMCGAFVATFGYFVLILIGVACFFPATWSQLTANSADTKDPTDIEKQIVQSIELPGKLLMVCPLLQILSAFSGGWLAARLAPMSPQGHAGLVAGFLVLTAVQMLLKNDGPFPEWLVAINLLVGPFAALKGASLYSSRQNDSAIAQQ